MKNITNRQLLAETTFLNNLQETLLTEAQIALKDQSTIWLREMAIFSVMEETLKLMALIIKFSIVPKSQETKTTCKEQLLKSRETITKFTAIM